MTLSVLTVPTSAVLAGQWDRVRAALHANLWLPLLPPGSARRQVLPCRVAIEQLDVLYACSMLVHGYLHLFHSLAR